MLSYRYRKSVRLTVRLSHSWKLVDCVHMIMVSLPYGSPMILVFRDIRFITKLEGDHPVWGHLMRVGRVWFGDFRPLSRHICETVQYMRSLIGNRIRAFDWYQNQRPWLTLKWPWTAIMHSVALHTCFLEPTTKIWMQIDPYYQRQKCSPGC